MTFPSNSEILEKWPEVFESFANAFDSPNAQRLMKGTSAQEARKQLHDFNDLIAHLNKDEQRDSERLGKAIADAALKAGIYNGEVMLTGLHLTVLTENMADTIVNLTKGWIPVSERLPRPYTNVTIGEPGLIKGIAWYRDQGHTAGVWETDQGICEIEFTHWYDIEQVDPVIVEKVANA